MQNLTAPVAVQDRLERTENASALFTRYLEAGLADVTATELAAIGPTGQSKTYCIPVELAERFDRRMAEAGISGMHQRGAAIRLLLSIGMSEVEKSTGK
jgi:hypothetical protein